MKPMEFKACGGGVLLSCIGNIGSEDEDDDDDDDNDDKMG
ncbi:hypothetical protein TIFTF001_026369 [Ficus carica]|uniref:Uncharacterized protein n=1 Tax=Ficus carica TaxID=3494 RepID=A0AA88DLI2_FICCA|nr:hypothetical protein TIFTF001_026369 [Ficus carica]